MAKIPDPEVEAAYWEAARTGMTDALLNAYERLISLLSMKPETVEAYMASRYHEV